MAGTKVELTGADKYKRDLKAIADQSKLLASEMKVVQSSFTSATTAQERHEASAETLAKQIENQKNKIETLNAAIEAEMQKENASEAVINKLTIERNNAQAALNKMQNAVDEVGDAEEDASEKTNIFGEALKANLASEAITSLVRALGDAIKDVANGIKEAYTGSVKWADDLATLSTITGISTETLQEYEYMAGLIDTDIDTITGAMTKLTRNMNTAREGTGASAEAFQKLGVAVTDADGSLRDNEEVFNEIIAKFEEMPDGAERDAIAMQLMGKSAQDLNPLIAAGADKLAALRQEAHDTGYVMSDEMMSGLLDSADAADRMTARMDGLKRQLSANLAPAVTQLQQKLIELFAKVDWDTVTTKITGMVDGFSQFCTWVQENSNLILSLFAGIAAGFAAFEVGSLITSVISILTQFGTVQAAVNAIMAANPLLLIASAIAVVVAGIVLLIANWEEVKAVALEVWAALVEGVTTAWTNITTAVTGIADGIRDKFVEIKSQMGTWVQENIIQPVKDKIAEFKNIGHNLVEGLWNGINDKVAWIKSKISGFVGDIEAWFKSKLGIASPSKHTYWMGEMLMEGLANGIGDNVRTITSAWGNATDRLGIPTENFGVNGSAAGTGGTVNIYAQSIDESMIDYVYMRVNQKMGMMA